MRLAATVRPARELPSDYRSCVRCGIVRKAKPDRTKPYQCRDCTIVERMLARLEAAS